MNRVFVFVAAWLGLTALLALGSERDGTVFVGIPLRKVFADGDQASASALTIDEAPALRVVITRKEGRYFWASRDNVELIRTVSGAYTTFVALTGAGYVRVGAHGAGLPSPYQYAEHILLGLRSVTYYGAEK